MQNNFESLLIQAQEQADSFHAQLLSLANEEWEKNGPCSYQKYYGDYLDTKGRIRYLRKCEEDYPVLSPFQEAELKKLIESLPILKKKRYENVCGVCPICSTRKKQWNVETHFTLI